MEPSGKIKNDNMSDQDFYKVQCAEPTRRLPQRLGFPGGVGAPHPTPYTKNVPARRVHQI